MTKPASDLSPQPPASASRRIGRFAWRVARILLICYLVILVMFYSLQTKLIYPGAATQGRPEANVTPPEGAELVELQTADGQRVVALFGEALSPEGHPRDDARRRPTILFFYGNGMCMADMQHEFTRFRLLGANVMIPEFVGYGMSGGSPSEKGCYATADAAYDWLAAGGRVDAKKIIPAGWSLGAAVAVDLAARRPAAGLLMFSPFTSLADVGKNLYPFLPVKPLLTDRFDSLQKIEKVTCPLIIGHGRCDDLVPCQMSERLAGAAKVPVTTIYIDDAGHNDFLMLAEGRVMAAASELIESLDGK